MFPSLSRATPTEYRTVNWLNWGMVTTVTQTREWSGVRASQVVLVVKNSPTNAGEARDMGLIPGLRRSPAEGNDQMVKNLAVMMETQVWSLGRKDPLEITTLENHSSILAWKVPITEVPGGLQSTGLQRVVGHKWTTNTCTFSFLSDSPWGREIWSTTQLQVRPHLIACGVLALK